MGVIISATDRNRIIRRPKSQRHNMDTFGIHVGAVRSFSSINVVGLLLGHNGACHIFRDLWNGDDGVHVLHGYKAGETNARLYRFRPYQLAAFVQHLTLFFPGIHAA